jgi:hypothetical protein
VTSTMHASQPCCSSISEFAAVVRSRPPVGRRLWRRRKKRGDDGGAGEDAAATGERLGPAAGASTAPTSTELPTTADPRLSSLVPRPRVGAADDAASDDRSTTPLGTEPVRKRGFWERLWSPKPATPDLVVPPSDALQALLALPRGIARLDAFGRALQTLVAGTPEHRRIAMALHHDLVTLAEDAQVDLHVVEARVVACVQALIAAHEVQKAAELLARLGRRNDAADLFAQAGAIDALEEAHAEEAWHEGGARLDAKLAFQRFEALFAVGLRDDALVALERACALWQNQRYLEVRDALRARIPGGGILRLVSGGEELHVLAGFPFFLGRGEECAVRVESPLVSRRHLEFIRREGSILVRDLVSTGGTTIDDQPIAEPTALRLRGTLRLAGVVVAYEHDAARLLLRPQFRPNERPGTTTLVPLGDVLVDPLLGAPLCVSGGQFRVRAGGMLGADVVAKDTLLLTGDRLQAAGRTWSVAAR